MRILSVTCNARYGHNIGFLVGPGVMKGKGRRDYKRRIIIIIIIAVNAFRFLPSVTALL
jgi:hypothetical protein